jgi:nicotinate phosphoribosyltransferase
MGSFLSSFYRSSLALFTDFYQLTMAYGYWKSGIAEQESVFHLYFRKNPFRGGYTIATGLQIVIEYIHEFRFQPEDLSFLKSVLGSDQNPLFSQGFLDYLKNLSFTCSLDAVPEGTVVFPNEPILRISGPLVQCQILETSLLNIINFHSLISTKASRIVSVAGNHPVLEFGLRRAQGFDGGLSASRAAYLGGCAATSNTLAGKMFNIPLRGTHSHSWVMAFDSEQQAFFELAKAMPNNTVFLIDTYDTLEGVQKAIEVGFWLKNQGKKILGIRLDSGDLAYLSIEARKMLDQAGFQDAVIIASNDLNEHVIANLKAQGAAIGAWGVGTQLVTAFDEPALGAVYKLAAIKLKNGTWKHCIKLSEQAIKISTPGILQVRRYFNKNLFVADMIFDTLNPPTAAHPTIIDPQDFTRFYSLSKEHAFEDLLKPIFKKGKLVYREPSLDAVRDYSSNLLKRFHIGIKRLMNPHDYPAGLAQNLHQFKTDLIYQAKKQSKKGLGDSL